MRVGGAVAFATVWGSVGSTEWPGRLMNIHEASLIFMVDGEGPGVPWIRQTHAY